MQEIVAAHTRHEVCGDGVEAERCWHRCVAGLLLAAIWPQDPKQRKSTSGASILSKAFRIHVHSRGQAAVASSPCEAGLSAAYEGWKETNLVRAERLFSDGIAEYRIVDGQCCSTTFSPHARCGEAEALGDTSVVPSRGSSCRVCAISTSCARRRRCGYDEPLLQCERVLSKRLPKTE